MSRRKRVYANRVENGQRCSIGAHYVDQACNNINTACAKEAAMFVHGLTAHEVIPMLFRDEDVAKLKAVHGLLAFEGTNHYYSLSPYLDGNIRIYTTDERMPTPAASCLYWQAERAEPLSVAVHMFNELHIKWGAVKHLLRWFNRNATIGAVRANWPSVLQLCPDAPSLKKLQRAPTRYTNPQELSALLPLIRTTATTVASMTMLPGDVSPRVRQSVIITLPERTVDYEGVAIELDSQQFYL